VYFLFRADRLATPQDKLISERVILATAMSAAVIATAAVSLQGVQNDALAQGFEALALLWLVGASVFLYRSIGALQIATSTRAAYDLEGDLVYIDSAAEKPKLVVSKVHGLSGRPDAAVMDGEHHIPVELRTGRVPRLPPGRLAGAIGLGRLVPVPPRGAETRRDLAEAVAQLPHLLAHPEHLLLERREAFRGEDAMRHEHADEHGADDRQHGDDHEPDEEDEERSDRIEPTRDDADLDRDEDADDQEPQEDPAGQPHGTVPRAGMTKCRSPPSGRVIRIGAPCRSFSYGKVKTMTVRFCESISR